MKAKNAMIHVHLLAQKLEKVLGKLDLSSVQGATNLVDISKALSNHAEGYKKAKRKEMIGILNSLDSGINSAPGTDWYIPPKGSPEAIISMDAMKPMEPEEEPIPIQGGFRMFGITRSKRTVTINPQRAVTGFHFDSIVIQAGDGGFVMDQLLDWLRLYGAGRLIKQEPEGATVHMELSLDGTSVQEVRLNNVDGVPDLRFKYDNPISRTDLIQLLMARASTVDQYAGQTDGWAPIKVAGGAEFAAEQETYGNIPQQIDKLISKKEEEGNHYTLALIGGKSKEVTGINAKSALVIEVARHLELLGVPTRFIDERGDENETRRLFFDGTIRVNVIQTAGIVVTVRVISEEETKELKPDWDDTAGHGDDGGSDPAL